MSTNPQHKTRRMFCRHRLTSCGSRVTTVGRLFNLYLCLFLLVLNLLSVCHLLTTVTSISATNNEDKDYSVTSILTNITHTWWFWPAGNSDDSSAAKPIDKTEHVSYDISGEPSPPDKIVSVDHSASDSIKSPVEFVNSIQTTKHATNSDFNIHGKHLPPVKNNRICHSCNGSSLFADHDEEYRQRIEYIKERILSRIGLKQPPRLLGDLEIPLAEYIKIAENTLNRDLTNFGNKRPAIDPNPIEDVDRVFIRPIKSDPKAPIFDLSNVNWSDNSKVLKSIHVMVNYNLTEYYYLTLMHDDTDLLIASAPRDRNTISNEFEFVSTVSPKPKDKSNNSNQGNYNHQHRYKHNNWKDSSGHWFRYDVTSLLGDYTDKIIRIHNENFDILKSVVVVEMSNSKFLRSKRSIDCSESVSFCCRQHFFVNFTTIGWSNWILHPVGYSANYCKGKCDLSNARYHHTTVISKYPAINLCCSPREMSPISLIYLDESANIYYKTLTDMMVESCDCA